MSFTVLLNSVFFLCLSGVLLLSPDISLKAEVSFVRKATKRPLPGPSSWDSCMENSASLQSYSSLCGCPSPSPGMWFSRASPAVCAESIRAYSSSNPQRHSLPEFLQKHLSSWCQVAPRWRFKSLQFPATAGSAHSVLSTLNLSWDPACSQAWERGHKDRRQESSRYSTALLWFNQVLPVHTLSSLPSPV